jgi:hypothetical protein
MYRVGTVGHRTFSTAEVAAFVAAACRSVLHDALREHGAVTAVSALAEGTDMLFAEAALELGLQLETVEPFAGYETDFTDPLLRARYLRLRAAAHEESMMPYHARSEEAYAAAMREIVEHCDMVVIAWDGSASRSSAGTGAAVKLVQQLGRPWVHLDVRDCSIRWHLRGTGPA